MQSYEASRNCRDIVLMFMQLIWLKNSLILQSCENVRLSETEWNNSSSFRLSKLQKRILIFICCKIWNPFNVWYLIKSFIFLWFLIISDPNKKQKTIQHKFGHKRILNVYQKPQHADAMTFGFSHNRTYSFFCEQKTILAKHVKSNSRKSCNTRFCLTFTNQI